MKKYRLIAVALVILVIITACSKSSETPNQEETPEAVPVAQYDTVPKGVSPLTGLPYEGQGKAIMVQIENTVAARPQSGITQADLIYEMEVESQITRLTAFFLSNYPEKVGPVRSARKQHMHLWKEWDYLYTYYGGSGGPGQNIYEIREEMGIQAPDNDGMKSGVAFSRSKDREAPHNAYSNVSSLIEKAYDYEPKQRSIYFDENTNIEGDTANQISFSYREDNKIKYLYNSESSQYERYINEEPVLDKEDNKQVTVKNIIVQHANHYKVADTVYTNIDLIGSGTAKYFTEGIQRKGTWERKSVDSLTVYYDENGEEIAFKPGVTYIQIVRTDTPVTVE